MGVFSIHTYAQDLLSILFDRTRPPASDRLLSKQRLGLLRLEWSSRFQILHHLQRALLWGLCRSHQVTQIQLHSAWDHRVLYYERTGVVMAEGKYEAKYIYYIFKSFVCLTLKVSPR